MKSKRTAPKHLIGDSLDMVAWLLKTGIPFEITVNTSYVRVDTDEKRMIFTPTGMLSRVQKRPVDLRKRKSA